MFVAVDRFNVASFWNTLSGKLVFKTILDKNSRIENAFSYKKHDLQARYENPNKQFDSLPQIIQSIKSDSKHDYDRDFYHRVKFMTLNVFDQD